jgi:hypothetical protein
MRVYKFCSYILSCRREPYSELDEQCEGEDGFDEAPHVLEGSGLTTVDGMEREIRGVRTRGQIQIHETSIKVRPLCHKNTSITISSPSLSPNFSLKK